jgi:hypothetical protein
MMCGQKPSEYSAAALVVQKPEQEMKIKHIRILIGFIIENLLIGRMNYLRKLEEGLTREVCRLICKRQVLHQLGNPAAVPSKSKI